MEDAQPNEVRLARKGSTSVPRVRPAYSPYRPPSHHRRQDEPRKRWIDHPKRIHPAASQHKHLRRDPRRPYHAKADPVSTHPDADINTMRRAAVSPSKVGVRDDHSDPVQCKELGLSHTKPASSHIVQSESACTGRRHDVMHTTHSSTSVEQQHSTRWSTFRSGRVDASLPSLSSGSKVSEAGASQKSGIGQTSRQVQTEDRLLGRPSDINAHPTSLDIRASTAPTCSTKDRQMSETLADQLRRPEAAACTSNSCDISSPVAIHSPSDNSPSVRGSTLGRDVVHISLGPHDKPRRLLHGDNFTYVVTAHGVVDQVDVTSALKWDRNVRSPPSPLEEFVDDTCILSHRGKPVIILGHGREQDPISLLDLRRGQVSRHIALRRNENTTKRCGASAVTSLMSPLQFASGSYDHRVHLWNIAQDLSGASAVELAIKHSSVVHSLLPILDTSHKLVSAGADRDVHVYDLSAERVVQTLKLSCVPYHAHRTDPMSCTLLEVSHLETQFEVRDYRIPSRAVVRFGFIAEGKRGRFDKADTWSRFVACGDRNGVVHLWDLRNVSKEFATQQRFDEPIVHVVSIGPRLLACSRKNEIAYVEFQGG